MSIQNLFFERETTAQDFLLGRGYRPVRGTVWVQLETDAPSSASIHNEGHIVRLVIVTKEARE